MNRIAGTSSNRTSQSGRRDQPAARRRRGFALIWLALVLLVLLGFAALAIDVGRIHLTRTELQGVADGAARAAARPLPQLMFHESIARAQAVVDSNTAGGGPIGFDVQQDDLEFGIWWRNTRTFEPMPANLLNHANAVRIRTHRAEDRGNPLPMTFAAAMGFDDVDVRALAVAMIRGGGTGGPGGGIGIFGMEWIELNGITRTDSYDSTLGAYDPNAAGSYGGLATNGHIKLVGTTFVKGDARWGPDGDISPETDYLSVNENSTITGWTAPLDEEAYFPPAALPDVYDNAPLTAAGLLNVHGDIRVSGNSSVTIPGGVSAAPNVYVVRDLIIRSNTTVNINGAIELYVTGKVDMTGNVLVNHADGSHVSLPSDFKIFVVNGGSVDIGGGSALYAQVYAPLSPVVIHGTSGESGLFGGVVGRTVEIKGNSSIHVDTSLEWPGQQASELRVELVQ